MGKKLEELEEELYGREDEAVKKRVRRRVFFPETLRRLPTAWREEKRPPGGPFLPDRKIFTVFVWSVAALVVLGGVVFLFLYLGTRGGEATITIHGRESIESGEALTIPVVVRNVSRTTLAELELAFLLPEGSRLIAEGVESSAPPRIAMKLDDLPPGESVTVELVARLFGREGEGKRMETVLLYRPLNLRAKFSEKAAKTFVISRVPLAISWEVPEKLSRGQEVEVRVRYLSQSNIPFENVSFRMDYPAGFSFAAADPAPSIGNTIWKLGTLAPGAEGLIRIHGTITGTGGEVKTFQGGLGVFNELTKEWRVWSESSRESVIAVTPLSVEVTLNGERDRTITPGERLTVTLRYQNNTEFSFVNVSVKAMLESGPLTGGGRGILAEESLAVGENGVFDAPSRTIIWGPGSVPSLRELSAGEGGEFTLRIETRERPPVQRAEDTNMIVRVRALIDAAESPKELAGTAVGSGETREYTVRSKVLFSGKSLYRSTPIPNSGPLPPRVGQRTSYTIVWEVRNFTNELAGVEVRANLPPNVRWENVVSPQDARLSFDQAAGVVRWTIGEVRPGTGILTPALLGGFKVSVVPAEADVGRPMTLIHESRLTGQDRFANVAVNEGVEPLTTELKEDTAATSEEGVVAP